MARKQSRAERKIIQLVGRYDGSMLALCNDGSVWKSERAPYSPHGEYNEIVWQQLPGLPDPEADAP